MHFTYFFLPRKADHFSRKRQEAPLLGKNPKNNKHQNCLRSAQLIFFHKHRLQAVLV